MDEGEGRAIRLWRRYRIAAVIALIASLASISSGIIDVAGLWAPRTEARKEGGSAPQPCTDIDPQAEWLLIKFSNCIEKEREAAGKRAETFGSIVSMYSLHDENRPPAQGFDELDRYFEQMEKHGDTMIRSFVAGVNRDRDALECFGAEDYKKLGQIVSSERAFICDKDIQIAAQKRSDAYDALSKILQGDSPQNHSLEAKLALDTVEVAEKDYFAALNSCLTFSRRIFCED